MKYIWLILLLLCASYGEAQYTTVSGTVTDTSGQTWQNGTWSADFIDYTPNGNAFIFNGAPFTANLQHYSGSLNSSGYFSQSIPSNTYIQPTNSAWRFTFCSNTSAPCQSFDVSVIGATLDLTSKIASTLTPPNVNFIVIPRAYADSEVPVNASNVGAVYENTLSNGPRYWNGSVWTPLAAANALLPTATQSGQALVSTGAGNNYAPTTLAPSATTDTTNAANVTSGVFNAARIPNLSYTTITGLGTAATTNSTAYDAAGAAASVQAGDLQKANNLSDLANAATARTNLGLGSAATTASTAYDAAGAATAAQNNSLQKASNLSDVANAATARTNLGITLPVGAIVGTTDTQTLTNKTLDGVTPATMAYLDATSSIQTQLNGKQGSLTLTTTGTSGAATLTGATLNIPNYATSSMVYPGAGVAVSTGTAWGASLTAPAGAIVGTTDTQTLTNKSIASTEITGLAASATTDTTNATNITSGTLASGRLPTDVDYIDVAQTITAAKTFNANNLVNIGSGTLPTGGGINLGNNNCIYGENSAGTTSAQIFCLNNNNDLVLGTSPGGTQSASDILTGLSLYYSANSPATSGANFGSPLMYFRGHYWTGSASANDDWYIQNSVLSGTNPSTGIQFVHGAGSTGAQFIKLPHVLGSGSAPTAAGGAASGTTPPTVTVTGTDTDFSMSFTAATGATTGVIATVTFNSTWSTTPRCVITPTATGSAGLSVWRSSISTTTVAFTTNTALASGTAYSWDVICAQ